MSHIHLPAEAVFYARAALLAAATASAAVVWDRWYIRRILIKEFVRQLRLEQLGRKL